MRSSPLIHPNTTSFKPGLGWGGVGGGWGAGKEVWPNPKVQSCDHCEHLSQHNDVNRKLKKTMNLYSKAYSIV